jgi:hypothetical protein
VKRLNNLNKQLRREMTFVMKGDGELLKIKKRNIKDKKEEEK